MKMKMRMTMTMTMRMKNKKKIVQGSNIEKLIEEPKEIKLLVGLIKISLRNILIIIDGNKFSYKNKIGELKYIDITRLVNNIINNTIREIDAKKCLNTLNITKNSEIKHRRIISGQNIY